MRLVVVIAEDPSIRLQCEKSLSASETTVVSLPSILSALDLVRRTLPDALVLGGRLAQGGGAYAMIDRVPEGRMVVFGPAVVPVARAGVRYAETMSQLRAVVRQILADRTLMAASAPSGPEDRLRFALHDINNLLAAASLNAGLIAEGDVCDDVRGAAMGITDAVCAVHRILESVRTAAGRPRRMIHTQPSMVDVPELMRGLHRRWWGRAVRTEHDLKFALGPSVGTVRADPDLLARVLDNLIDNALSYSEPGTTIVVEASCEPGQLQIRVCDEGPGVPVEERDQIFKDSVRIRAGRVVHRPGHGLGLAFCRQAVSAHEGRIWVESNHPRGSRFCLRLPTAPTGAPALATAWRVPAAAEG